MDESTILNDFDIILLDHLEHLDHRLRLASLGRLGLPEATHDSIGRLS